MTDPIVVVAPSHLHAEPGGHARAEVTVRNLGRIVDGFRIDVLGDGPPSWATVEPAELRILPGEEATATVVFSPPAGNKSTGGTYPFGILASSTVDPHTCATAEGELEVADVFDLHSRLSPTASTGRWRARHIFEVTNWGNSLVELHITATDPDDQLGFLVTPAMLEVPVGTTAISQVRVRTRHPRLRGSVTRLPFSVTAVPGDRDERQVTGGQIVLARQAMVEGAFTQRPILSRFVIIALTLVVAVGAGLIALGLRQQPAQAALSATGTPNTPVLAVNAIDSESVQLSWTAQPNIKSYNMVEVLADGTLVNATMFGGVLTGTVAGKLTPKSHHCYRLQAVRGDFSSLFSDPACATTGDAPASTPKSSLQAASSSSAASQVAGASAAPTTSTSATVPPAPGSTNMATTGSSTSSAGGRGGGALEVVSPSVGSASPPASGEASSGSPTSAVRSSAAGSTTGPSSSTRAQADGIFTPEEFIAVLASPFVPPTATNMAMAEKLAATLPAGDHHTGVVNTSRYSHFLVQNVEVINPSMYVYAGTFNSGEAAAAFCDQHVSDWPMDCYVAHPGPPAGQ